jgi:hypothetical protein
MSAPAWLRWALAGVMLAVAGYHLVRLVLLRSRWDVELGHAAMGAAMVMMLVATPSGPRNRDLALVFAAAAAWFGGRSAWRYVLDGPRGVGLLVAPMVGSAAMAYMLAGPSHMSSMTGMSTPSAVPALLGPVLIVAVAGSAATALRRSASVPDLGLGPAAAQLAAGRAAGRPRPDPARHRALAVGCGLAVNLTTVYMLVTM